MRASALVGQMHMRDTSCMHDVALTCLIYAAGAANAHELESHVACMLHACCNEIELYSASMTAPPSQGSPGFKQPFIVCPTPLGMTGQRCSQLAVLLFELGSTLRAP